MISVMNTASQPGAAALQLLLAQIDPGLRLVASRTLAGGVSAQVTVVEAELPDGRAERLVVHQYGTANLRSDPLAATHEHRLLTLLHAAGLPVPLPRHSDESRRILPAPYLVTEFADGEAVTDAAKLTWPLESLTGQLAAVLAMLHGAGFTLADAPHLADLRGIATDRMETSAAEPDAALNEAGVRAGLARIWPPPQVNKPVLLHGDFWPGNALWRDGRLVCVLDWEDALLGDPLADLGNARMELCMLFGTAAAAAFLRQYRALAPDVDLTALPHWDLYAALRHAGRMRDWGLPADELARLQAGHRDFSALVLTELRGR